MIKRVENSLGIDIQRIIKESRDKGITYKELLEHFEMEFLLQVLDENNFNISKSALILKINRNTLSKKIDKYSKYKFFKDYIQEIKSRNNGDNK